MSKKATTTDPVDESQAEAPETTTPPAETTSEQTPDVSVTETAKAELKSVPPDTVDESLRKAFDRIYALDKQLAELVAWLTTHTHPAAGFAPAIAPPAP